MVAGNLEEAKEKEIINWINWTSLLHTLGLLAVGKNPCKAVILGRGAREGGGAAGNCTRLLSFLCL